MVTWSRSAKRRFKPSPWLACRPVLRSSGDITPGYIIVNVERLRERFADSPWSGKAGQFLASPLQAGPPAEFAGPKRPNDEPETPAEEADGQEPTK